MSLINEILIVQLKQYLVELPTSISTQKINSLKHLRISFEILLPS